MHYDVTFFVCEHGRIRMESRFVNDPEPGLKHSRRFNTAAEMFEYVEDYLDYRQHSDRREGDRVHILSEQCTHCAPDCQHTQKEHVDAELRARREHK